MSFFANLATKATALANVARVKAVEAAEATKATIANLRDYPNEQVCHVCESHNPVPPELFQWKCPADHVNWRRDSSCLVDGCEAKKPDELPTPLVTCSCGEVLEVSTNNFVRLTKQSYHEGKKATKKLAAETKEFVKHMSDTPSTFHCKHCDQLLQVPTGPWTCQRCAFVNNDDQSKCQAASCSQKKSQQMLICGVCEKSTEVPTTNFSDSIRHGFRDLANTTNEAWYWARGKQYTICPRCQASVELPKHKDDNKIDTGDEGVNLLDERKEGPPSHVTCPKCDASVPAIPVSDATPDDEVPPHQEDPTIQLANLQVSMNDNNDDNDDDPNLPSNTPLSPSSSSSSSAAAAAVAPPPSYTDTLVNDAVLPTSP